MQLAGKAYTKSSDQLFTVKCIKWGSGRVHPASITSQHFHLITWIIKWRIPLYLWITVYQDGRVCECIRGQDTNSA